VTALYTVSGSGCTSRLAVEIPAARVDGQTVPGERYTMTLPWSQVTSVRIKDAYVVVYAPGLPANGRHLFGGDAAGAARINAVVARLTRACGAPVSRAAVTSAPAPAPRPAVQAGARDLVAPARPGAYCTFRSLPGLEIAPRHGPYPQSYSYAVFA